MNNVNNIHRLSLEELLKETKFAVEASGFEQHALWAAHHQKLKWSEQVAGYGAHVGDVGDMPVFLSLLFKVIEGHVVLFWEATSQVVDYRMVDAWLAKNVPATWDEGTRRARSDATNFHHCIQALAQLNRTENGQTAVLPAAPETQGR